MIDTPEWRESIRMQSAQQIDLDLENLNDAERVNLGKYCEILIISILNVSILISLKAFRSNKLPINLCADFPFDQFSSVSSFLGLFK